MPPSGPGCAQDRTPRTRWDSLVAARAEREPRDVLRTVRPDHHGGARVELIAPELPGNWAAFGTKLSSIRRCDQFSLNQLGGQRITATIEMVVVTKVEQLRSGVRFHQLIQVDRRESCRARQLSNEIEKMWALGDLWEVVEMRAVETRGRRGGDHGHLEIVLVGERLHFAHHLLQGLTIPVSSHIGSRLPGKIDKCLGEQPRTQLLRVVERVDERYAVHVIWIRRVDCLRCRPGDLATPQPVDHWLALDRPHEALHCFDRRAPGQRYSHDDLPLNFLCIVILEIVALVEHPEQLADADLLALLAQYILEQLELLPWRRIMNAEVVNGSAKVALKQTRPAFRLVHAPAERERITECEYLRGTDFRRFAEPQFIDADGDGVFLED